MVLVPAFGQRQETPPPPPPSTDEKPIIPTRMYSLLLASGIAGISLAANAFLAFQLMSVRDQRGTVIAERDKLRADKAEVDRQLAAANGNLTQFQGYAENLNYGRTLYAEVQALRDEIKKVADAKNRSGETQQIYTRLGPIPELNEARWPQELQAYRTKLQAEMTVLQAKPARPGPAPPPALPTQPGPPVNLPRPDNR